MLRFKNTIKALVLVCLSLFALSFTQFDASSFDNSDFVSEISSEELEKQEVQKQEEDTKAYNERIALRTPYQNFSGIKAYTDTQEFKTYKKSVYDRVEEPNPNDDYYEVLSKLDQDQKTAYYIAMFGESGDAGLIQTINEFNKKLVEYNTNANVVVDASASVDSILAMGAPSLNVDNLEYINDLNNLISNFESQMKVINRNQASAEEIQAAEESNVMFTRLYQLKLNEIEYLSIPKVKITKRLMNNQVIMNIGLLVGIVILFVVRFPIVKKQQEYAWNKFRPLSLLAIPLVALLFFMFFNFFFGVTSKQDTTAYDIYMNGVQVTTADRIYLDKEAVYKLDIISTGYENTLAKTSIDIVVTSDPNSVATGGELETVQYGELGVSSFTSEMGNTVVITQNTENKYAYHTINEILVYMGFEATNRFEPDDLLLPAFVNSRRNVFILPTNLVLIIPSLMFGTLFFMFLLMPGPMVKMYLNELYTINRFCGFLAYNMSYRSNARVLIEETLQSLEACKFAEDFAIIFFEKDRDMTDKIQDIAQIYSYKFFEMYLGIVNIIFDEGVSDSTLKSLSIIQQFGDEYYNQADMFFKSKKGAIGSLMMIIMICMALPIMVKTNVGAMFIFYLTTPTGYTFTIGAYLVWFGLICVIYNLYKNNKIVRKEGRYV